MGSEPAVWVQMDWVVMLMLTIALFLSPHLLSSGETVWVRAGGTFCLLLYSVGLLGL